MKCHKVILCKLLNGKIQLDFFSGRKNVVYKEVNLLSKTSFFRGTLTGKYLV